MVIEWNKGHAPDGNATALLDAVAPFLPPLFDLLHRARPNAAVFAAQRAWRRLCYRKSPAGRIVGGGAALCVLLAFPFHYTIKADCRIVPKTKRVISAPFQSQLRKSTVQPGDTVHEGDALAELDDRELKLKEAELTAAREHALKQRDRALRNEGEGADFSAAQVADFEARSVGEELAIVRQKLALLDVRAPIAGTIIAGDLRRAEGQPVQQGQILFEVAPLDEMLVEIDVPDPPEAKAASPPGQSARIRLEAYQPAAAGRRPSTGCAHPQSEQQRRTQRLHRRSPDARRLARPASRHEGTRPHRKRTAPADLDSRTSDVGMDRHDALVVKTAHLSPARVSAANGWNGPPVRGVPRTSSRPRSLFRNSPPVPSCGCAATAGNG